MKLVYNWRILQRPLAADQRLKQVIDVPARQSANELLANESLATIAVTHNMHSPLIPVVFAYCVHEGEQYQIDVEARIEKKALRVLERRQEDRCYLYLLVKVLDHELYDSPFELQLFIKYGLPQSTELLRCMQTKEVGKFVQLLSSRETTLHSQFIYEKIKKELCVQEPLEVMYKLGVGYLLFSLTNKETAGGSIHEESGEHSITKATNLDESFQLSPKKEAKAPTVSNAQIIVESIELMSWLATGRHMNLVRKLPLAYTNEPFQLAPEECYNVLLRVDLVDREAHIPYLVKWRWDYSPEVFGMLKYIVLQEHE